MKFPNWLNDFTGQVVAFLSAAAAAAGFIIINLHLGQYNISDYSLFNAKAIHTGIVFMLIIGSAVIIIFAFLETRDYTKSSLKDVFINFMTKPVYLTNIFFITLAFTYSTPEHALSILSLDIILIATFLLVC